MLIFALYKAVPQDIAKVATVGGILKREEAQLVINPHDVHAIEAAEYFKRLVGGKVISLSMGPHQRVIPIANTLYNYEVWGIDEAYILSDRRMAGADTRATAYTLSLGIKKIIEFHEEAVSRLVGALEENKSVEEIVKLADDLYQKNLLPNKIYSDKPSIKDLSLVNKFARGEISRRDLVNELENYRESLRRDLVLFLGMKAVDGETGNTGPQLSQALSEAIGTPVTHATYVTNFSYDFDKKVIRVVRRMGRVIQEIEMDLPTLLTMRPEYEAPPITLNRRREAVLESFRGKVYDIRILNADDIRADLRAIGLIGSPTQVGPTIEVRKVIIKKIVGKSLKILSDIDKFKIRDREYGPYKKGDIITDPPKELVDELVSKNLAKIYDYNDLAEEIIGILTKEAKIKV